jgi:hypothetical protein
VKKISHEQSRRNIARRRRKVAARHARAGHWGAQPKPMFTSGKVGYEVGANTDATCFGGIAAVHRLVVKLGLVDQIDDGLELLKVHLPYCATRRSAVSPAQRGEIGGDVSGSAGLPDLERGQGKTACQPTNGRA